MTCFRCVVKHNKCDVNVSLKFLISLIRRLFTPCIAKRQAGQIETSTPVVMPILKIKSKQGQSRSFVSHVWRLSEKHKGKWWLVSRCELVGRVTSYWGSAQQTCGIVFNDHLQERTFVVATQQNRWGRRWWWERSVQAVPNAQLTSVLFVFFCARQNNQKTLSKWTTTDQVCFERNIQ